MDGKWTNFVISLLRSSYNKICIDESSNNHYAEFITPITRISYSTHALLQHGTIQDIKTTYDFIDANRLELDIRSLHLEKEATYVLSIKSRSIHIGEKFEIDCHLTRKEIYIYIYLDIFFLYLFLPILKEFNYQIYTKFSRDYSTVILFFANILNISSFLVI